MRVYAFLLTGLMLLAPAALAQESYNYALGTQPVGTFISASSAVDNSTATFAQSGNVNESPQFLTLDLGREIYIGSVKIYWNASALSRNYSIRVSRDKKNWFTEFSGLDAAEAPLDAASSTKAQVVSARRYTMPSRYVQIYLPMGSGATAPQVGIAEIQILPAENLKFSLLEVTPYAVGSNRAIVVYRTSIGAATGQVLYGRDPNLLNGVASNTESGVMNSAMLYNLDPGFNYYYKVEAWDAFGNQVTSALKYFKPPKFNLALNKPVSGTFDKLPPDDKLVDRSQPVMPRITDGSTGYFKSMATSGSLRRSDQKIVVDLGASYPLQSLISYWRALAYPESYSVRVSSDNATWTEVANHINAGEGAFARSDNGDPMRVINTPLLGKEARFIEIFIPKDSPYFVKHANWDFVQLMEVEVYPK